MSGAGECDPPTDDSSSRRIQSPQIRTYPGPYTIPGNLTIPFFMVNRLNAEVITALVTGDPPPGQAPGLGSKSLVATISTPPIQGASEEAGPRHSGAAAHCFQLLVFKHVLTPRLRTDEHQLRNAGRTGKSFFASNHNLVDSELNVWKTSAAAAQPSTAPSDGPQRQWNVLMRNAPYSPVRHESPSVFCRSVPHRSHRASAHMRDKSVMLRAARCHPPLRPQEAFPASPLPDWSGPPFSSLDPYARPWTLAAAAPDPACASRDTCAQCLTADFGDQVRWQAPRAALGGGFVALMNVDDFACYQTYAQYTSAAAGGGASAVLIYYTDREARAAGSTLEFYAGRGASFPAGRFFHSGKGLGG